MSVADATITIRRSKEPIMDITEAYNILHKYYSKEDLRWMYNRKKFDGSEYDSYKKLDYNAELLREKAMRLPDKEEYKEERQRCYDAARVFEMEARKGRALR